ncbi:YceI family protein [Methylophaga sp.]|uniref:YceI family protein n=1 Tax=Methylophaga sp. TaxID=2024840 RepID=UPI0027260345|nr:YceI family protein [Methylophaga sp.]MDO8827998.1 YceI family protein [Methylophaga sp.]
MFKLFFQHTQKLSTALLAGGLLAASGISYADWDLDNADSQLHFMSVKSSSIAELHTFKTISGSLLDSGQAELVIDLNSVDTKVPIRDERMQSMLFDTANFPQATLTTKVDIAAVKALKAGQTLTQDVELQLDLHGQTRMLPAQLQVTALASGKLMVATTAPVIIKAEDFDLVEGINALRDEVGLPSITLAVPVTATLFFNP